jgi:hypothetical protein
MKGKYAYPSSTSNDALRVSDNYSGVNQHSVLSRTNAFLHCAGVVGKKQVMSTSMTLILKELIIVVTIKEEIG